MRGDEGRADVIGGVCRMLEQHNKEVSEMDHLLQEELQLAKASQQETVSWGDLWSIRSVLLLYRVPPRHQDYPATTQVC